MRVFVSSTIRDLEDVRAEVNSLLVELGFQSKLSDWPGSDFDTTIPGNKINVCLDNISGSDIFILILSQRYGSQCEDMREISMIHREYRHAKEHGMRIIGFRRNGLLEDYFKWKEDKDTPLEKYNCINRDEWDTGLFRLIDECSEEANGVQVENWWNNYKYSIDLKTRLVEILEKESGVVKLKQLVKSGNLPFFSAKLSTMIPSLSHGDDTYRVELEYANLGDRPALGVKLGGDFTTIKGAIQEFGDLRQYQAEHRTIIFSKKPEFLEGKKKTIFLDFFFEFETMEQLTIRDWFHAEFVNDGNCNITSNARLVRKEYVKHEGWQITDSEGESGVSFEA